MHAFDVARLAGPEIRVRRARAGRDADHARRRRRGRSTRRCSSSPTTDSAVALAGVMGGAATEVSSATTRIALESAWFLPASVRATSRKLGLKTEASARFERGADLTAPGACAAPRAGAAREDRRRPAGRRRSSTSTRAPAEPRRVTLRRARIARLLGRRGARPRRRAHPHARSGFGLTPSGRRLATSTCRRSASTWPARPISSRKSAGTGASTGFPPRSRRCGAAAARRAGRRARPPPAAPALRRRPAGGRARSRSSSERPRSRSSPTATTLVAIANPLSEKFAVLRPSLLPGLLDALVYSRRRETADVRLFEAGAVFRADGRVVRAGLGADRARVGALERAGRRARLLRRQRRGRARRRAPSASSSTRGADRGVLLVRARTRRASSSCTGTASASSWARSASFAPARRRARPVATDAVYGGELDLGALDRAAGQPATSRIDSAAALPVDRPRSVDSRRRTLACRRSSWHDSSERAADARVGARVRSVSGRGRAGRSDQFVGSPHVPRSRPDADRQPKCSTPSTPSSPRCRPSSARR